MVAYALKKNLANKSNYGSKRKTSNIKYIVIHYTGNNGDTDENNGKYFHNNIVKASAHYFVDSDSVTQSVLDDYVAYSVGGAKYNNGGGKYYGKCTNMNSISIELCDDVKDKKIYPSVKTIENAVELTKKLMKQYGIKADHVIRHYDVTGKSCPAYWCGTSDKNKKWKTEFHNKLTAQSKPTTKVKKAYTGTFPKGTLKKGNKGTQVKNLQKFLNWYENYKLEVDGVFGANTYNAVKKFQKATGLSVDGIFGPKSLSKAKSIKM